MKPFKRVAFTGVLLLALGVLTLHSQPEPAAGKHPLWRVQGKENVVWLHGSIHFLKPEFYPLPEPIEQAYRDSGIVVFETEMDPLKMLGASLKMARIGSYPAGETLKENVAPDVYAALQERLKKSGLPGALAQSMRPWMAAMMLAVLELQRLGFDPEHGVDRYFHRKAIQDGKTVVSLETLEFQVALFDGLAKDEQEAFLKQTLEDFDRFEEMFGDIIAAWRGGEVARLDALILETMRDHPEIYKKFLADRNRAWIPELERLLKQEKNVFVVVGAAHLIGKENVLELLEARGYRGAQR